MTLAQTTAAPSDLLHDALTGLTAAQKSIDPKWLYDTTGSTIFEEITALPEYYPTRTETKILQTHAQHLASLVPQNGSLVEFGSGASVKTRSLLDTGTHIGTYVPIDISADFLHITATDLRQRYPQLSVQPVVGDFLNPVHLPDGLASSPKVGFFPGSTIGNISPAAAQNLLSNARSWPTIQAFILGVDLVKDIDTLVQAYDDTAGVTAKFISNVLVRLNTELGADFQLSNFNYEAKWNTALARIEMSLVSTTAQTATLGDTQITFRAGEKIAVSMSRKYTPDTVQSLAQAAGWHLDQMLMDDDAKFAVTVLKPA